MNPYPYFEDRWNQVLMGCCAANVVALVMLLALPSRSIDLRQLSDPAWVPSPAGVFILFVFVACLLATLILWINMWMYWARTGRPLVWMLLLAVGGWGPAVVFHFMVYRKDLEAFKRQEAEERLNLTHF